MTRAARTALAIAATALLLVSIPAAAGATSWGVLSVYEYHTLRGQAHGNANISSGTRAANTSIYNGTPAAGTRVETQYWFWKLATSGQYKYMLSIRLDTPTWNSFSYKTYTVSQALSSSASKVRMSPRICVPKPWGTPVPCSPLAYVALAY